MAKAVAGDLGKTVDQEVTQEDLNKVTAFRHSGAGISSIEGIQYLNYLNNIQIANNNITDLSPFTNWEHKGNWNGYSLWHLSIQFNPITDLSPLTSIQDLSVSDFYMHGLPIGNDQIPNLNKINNQWYIGRYTFGSHKIDNFSQLSNTWINRLSGYANIGNWGHKVDLGTYDVKSGKDLVVNNPSLYFDGSTIPVRVVSNKGVASADQKSVSWDSSELLKDKPSTLTFDVYNVPNGQNGTLVTYTVHLNYDNNNSSVITKYVDEQGNEIEKSESLQGKVGAEYTTEQKDISGYTFKNVDGNPKGKYTEEEQIVTYIYTKQTTKPVEPKPVEPTKPTLPNTVSNKETILSVLGAVLLAVTGLIFFNKRK